MAHEWIDNERKTLSQNDGEVLAFHPEWIDEDFNPNGTRVGFINGDGCFYSAKWCNTYDTYENCELWIPSHYMLMPKMPPEFLFNPNQLDLFA